MKANGTWLVPTAVVTDEGAMEFYKKIGSPPWYLDRVRSTRIDHHKMLQTAIKLGVNIALGTDQFPFEPNAGTTATVHEAELYVAAGMTPLDALRAATHESRTHAGSGEGSRLAGSRLLRRPHRSSTATRRRTSRAADHQIRDEGRSGHPARSVSDCASR